MEHMVGGRVSILVNYEPAGCRRQSLGFRRLIQSAVGLMRIDLSAVAVGMSNENSHPPFLLVA